MPTLILTPLRGTTPEERADNKALIDRYFPELPEYLLEARDELGAKMGQITIVIPESDVPFVLPMLGRTKKLLK